MRCPDPVRLQSVVSRGNTFDYDRGSDEVLGLQIALYDPECFVGRIEHQASGTATQDTCDTDATGTHSEGPSKPPTLQHVADIGGRFAVARDAACTLHSTRSGIVSGESEMDHPELIDHLT